MIQYEIWWADLHQPRGYEYLNKFIAAEITTTIRNIAVEVPLGATEGLRERCVANCDNLRTVPRSSLSKRAGRLPPARYAELKRAVGYALGWEELIESGS